MLSALTCVGVAGHRRIACAVAGLAGPHCRAAVPPPGLNPGAADVGQPAGPAALPKRVASQHSARRAQAKLHAGSKGQQLSVCKCAPMLCGPPAAVQCLHTCCLGASAELACACLPACPPQLACLQTTVAAAALNPLAQTEAQAPRLSSSSRPDHLPVAATASTSRAVTAGWFGVFSMT